MTPTVTIGKASIHNFTAISPVKVSRLPELCNETFCLLEQGKYNKAVNFFSIVIDICEKRHLVSTPVYALAHYGRGAATYHNMLAKGLSSEILYKLAIESLADLTLYHSLAPLHEDLHSSEAYLDSEKMMEIIKKELGVN